MIVKIISKISDILSKRSPLNVFLLNINNDYHITYLLSVRYLAVDTQLYCMGLAIFVFCQSSRRRKLVLSALFIVGLILPAFHTYLQDLNGPLLASPA